MPAHEVVQERHALAASDADLEIASQIIVVGVEETGIARRSLIKRSLGLALGLFALPGVLLLRDLGPLPRKSLDTTLWKANSPLLNAETGNPVKLGDLEIGSFTTVVPVKVEDMSEEDYAKTPVLLIRLEPGHQQAGSRPRELGVSRPRRVFEDLHARWLPDRVVPKADSQVAVPVPPIDL